MHHEHRVLGPALFEHFGSLSAFLENGSGAAYRVPVSLDAGIRTKVVRHALTAPHETAQGTHLKKRFRFFPEKSQKKSETAFLSTNRRRGKSSRPVRPPAKPETRGPHRAPASLSLSLSSALWIYSQSHSLKVLILGKSSLFPKNQNKGSGAFRSHWFSNVTKHAKVSVVTCAVCAHTKWDDGFGGL